MKLYPKISIITAVLNSGNELEKTIFSVKEQTYTNIEYIVIDGNSDDNTFDIIQKHKNFIYSWISEPDEGISDAFNKGVRISTGDLILFLGAGDLLYNKEVIVNLMNKIDYYKKPYFIYGDLYYKRDNRLKLIKNNYSMKRFKKYMCIPHQALFLDKFFFKKYGLFSKSYKFCMDYEHTARFIEWYPPEYLPATVSVMDRSGVSTNVFKAHKEMDKVRKKYNLSSNAKILFDSFVLSTKFLFKKLVGV